MKYPVLFKRGTEDFDNNGLGVLADAYDIRIKEVLNGLFTLDMKYPYTSKLAEEIKGGDIIAVNASNRLKNQKFRILSVTQENNLTLTIHAFHKSFDTTTDYVRRPLDIKQQSCEYALNMLFNKSYKSKNYVGYSDIINKQDFKCSGKQLASAIIGSEGSLIDTYGNGAQIERDNSTVDKISILQRRGHDTNILISYGKNMTGYRCIKDEQKLCTVLIPYAIDPQTQEKIIGDDILAPNYNDYDGELYICEYDVSDRVPQKAEITKSLLTKLGTEYMEESKCYIPKLTYVIDFVKLSQYGYPKDYNLDKLQSIDIGDTVIVYHRHYKVRTQVRVTEIEYDPISESYIKLVLGDVRASYDSLGSSGVIVGPPGPQGPQGPPGEDGNIGDFPDSLPPVPELTGETRGMSTITLTWTYENKVYYDYELYASQDADFRPTAFDLLYKGKASSYTYNVNPNETWYYYVRAVNSHGHSTQFSNKVTITTHKIPDGYTYFEKGAIGDALIDTLDLGRGWVGQLTADYLNVKGYFDVTDGNGKSTFSIDSFGQIRANFTNIQLNSEDVSTIPYVEGVTTELATEIKGFEEKITPDALKRVFSTEFYTKDSADSQFTSKTEFEQNNREFLLRIEQTGRPQLIPNGALREGTKFWNKWQAQNTVELIGGLKWYSVTPQFELGVQSYGVMMPEFEVQSGKTYTIGCWVSGDVTNLNYNYLMQLRGDSMIGVQRLSDLNIGNVTQQSKRVSITFTATVTGFVQPMFGHEGVLGSKILRVAEACCFEGSYLYPYQEADNTIYNNDAYFDITGMGMKHEDGSISRITSKSFELTDIYERLKMAMKKGTIYAYDAENGHFLGMFGSNKLNNTYRGVTTGISGSSHYYAIGASKALADTDVLDMTPYILIAQQDLQNVFGQSYISGGINFMNTPCIFHRSALFKSSPRFEGGFTIVKSSGQGMNIYEANNSLYVEASMRLSTGGSYYGGGLYGEAITSIGYKLGGSYTDVIKLYANIQQVDFLRPLNMNNFGIYNATIASNALNFTAISRLMAIGAQGPQPERNIIDEIEVRDVVASSIEGEHAILDVSNVQEPEKVMADENNVDMQKLEIELLRDYKDTKLKLKVAEGKITELERKYDELLARIDSLVK